MVFSQSQSQIVGDLNLYWQRKSNDSISPNKPYSKMPVVVSHYCYCYLLIVSHHSKWYLLVAVTLAFVLLHQSKVLRYLSLGFEAFAAKCPSILQSRFLNRTTHMRLHNTKFQTTLPANQIRISEKLS